jgi:hypothetical protein
MIIRAVLVWVGLLVVAILNGGFREAVLTPRFGRSIAHGVSTVMLSLFIVALGWMTTPWVGPKSLQDAWMIGSAWVALTLAFEFLGGHFIFGRPWQTLLADYNLLAGRIWVMVLIVTLMTPVIAFTRGPA